MRVVVVEGQEMSVQGDVDVEAMARFGIGRPSTRPFNSPL